MASGWFELKKASNGQFHFVLKSGNAETILSSEMYVAKPSAQNGIESVQKNAATTARYEKLTASNGKFYFTLKAANHQIIGNSQMYGTEDAREQGMASVQANGVTTTVKDLS